MLSAKFPNQNGSALPNQNGGAIIFYPNAR